MMWLSGSSWLARHLPLTEAMEALLLGGVGGLNAELLVVLRPLLALGTLDSWMLSLSQPFPMEWAGAS